MNTYISLLRGINVGGRKQLAMEDLRRIYEIAGVKNTQTYVQSGNVVFESPKTDTIDLRKQLEAAIEAACGYNVPVFIRQANDFERILKGNPFYNLRQEDPRWLHVTFLYDAPISAAWDKLIVPAGIVDEFARDENAIYLFCPNGYGKTRLSNSFFERKLSMMTTTRNWNTVNALYKMAKGYATRTFHRKAA